MASVRGKNTKPEMDVRRLVYSLGYRYRLHGKGLPGRPDLVFKKRRKVIFIHGCFWHHHKNCLKSRLPSNKVDFWRKKMADNLRRDRRNQNDLAKAGWEALVIWECELKDVADLEKRIKTFIEFNS